MFEGIKILNNENQIDFESLSKNDKGQFILEGIESIKVYLENGALYNEEIKISENDTDVIISLTDSSGNNIEFVLQSLSDILLKNQEEIPVFEVFNGSEKVASFKSIDELEAAAAGNQTLTSSQTSDFAEDDGISQNEIGTSGQNVGGFSSAALLDTTDPTYNENISFSGDLTSQITEDFAQEESGVLSGTISNDDPNYGATPFIPQTTTTEYGVFSIDENGNWTYELFSDSVQSLKNEELLSESFTVQLLGRDTTTTVEVGISGINDAPTIEIRDDQNVDEDGELRIPFSVSDVESDEITTTATATNGTVKIEDGEIVFTPEENYNGPATITITLDDGNGGVTTKTVNVTVSAVNDTPVGDPLNIEVTEESLDDEELELGSRDDTAYNGQLVASDIDGDSLSFSRVGTIGLTISTTNEELLAALNPETADLDYFKSILLEVVNIPEVSYALSNNLNSTGINVTELIAQLNAAPDVTTALELVVGALEVGNINLVTTATGLDIVIEDASALEAEGLLNVEVNEDGTYTVTSPLFNHLSTDDSVEVTFDYSASDGVASVTETVKLDVTGSNDAPEVEGLYSGEEASSWQLTAGGVSIAELESFAGDTISNIGSSPFQGSAIAVKIDAQEGETISFKWDFNDIETLNSQDANDFSFVLINGILTTLEDVLDTDVDGNTIFNHAFTDAGQYDFVFGVVNSLDSHFDSELYVEHVSGGTIISTEIIGNVSEMNVSSLDFLSVDEHTEIGTVIGIVEASDVDVLDNLSYSLVSPSDKFEIDPVTGEIKVISELDFETQSEYEIEVKVSDSNGGEVVKTITVNVLNINELPIIENIPDQEVKEGNSLTIPFTVTDPDGDNLTTTVSSTNGTAQIIDDEIVFTPNADFWGEATVTINVNDGNGGVISETINVNVLEQKVFSDKNLLTNGSFEDVTLEWNWEHLNGEDVPGWDTDNVIETWGVNGPGRASDGDNLIELDSNTGLDSISQELNLTAGTYLLEFNAANRGDIDSTNDFKIIWGDQEIIITSDMMKNDSEWVTFSFELEAPIDGVYELKFEELSSSNDGFGTLLDNIQLYPEAIEVEAISNTVNEEDLLDIQLTSTSNEDTTYNGTISNENDENVSYSKSGTIGLTINTTFAPLLVAVTPGTEDLDYVKTVLSEIVAIPEVTLALSNNLNAVPNMDVATLIAQFQASTDVTTALGLVTNALGLTNASLTLTTDGLSLVINDATALESEGLLNVEVNSDGTYSITSPLFNYLGENDSVSITFDYQADNGFETATETVTLDVNGSNDLAEVKVYGSDNLLVNGSFEDISLSGWEHLNGEDVPGWDTDNVIETWGVNGPGRASDGDNLIELDSNTGLDSISQELNLTAGTYLLEFNAANRGDIDSTNDFKIIWGDQEIIITSDMMKNDSEWVTFNFELEAPTDGVYELKFEELSSSNNGFGTLLDNIQLHGNSGSEILTIGSDPDINDSGVIDMAELLSNTQGLSGTLDEIISLEDNHILSNISVEDVLSITDTDNTLEITGDIGDKLLLNLGSEISDASEIASGDTTWHKDTSASTATEEVYVGKSSTDETITLLINGINVEDV